MKKRIVIFASGSGTNAQNIITYFENSEIAKVVHVLTNNEHAKVKQRAESKKVAVTVFSKRDLQESDRVLKKLQSLDPDLIVLAGFLLKFPESILRQFPQKVINIHPALLPKYGGKGMYGLHVHKAVVANAEKETGITVHFVNENYDEGAIIQQKMISLDPTDTPETVAKKVQALEHEHFPKIIESLLAKTQTLS